MKKMLLVLAALFAMAGVSQAQQVLFSTCIVVVPTAISTTTNWLIPNTVVGAYIHDIDISWDSDASTAPIKLDFYENVRGTAYQLLWSVTVGDSGTSGGGSSLLKQWQGAYCPRADYGLTVIQDVTATGAVRTADQIQVNVQYR